TDTKRLKHQLTEISNSNLNQLKPLINLNKQEKLLFDKIQSSKLEIIHRTTLEQFKYILQTGGLISHSHQKIDNPKVTAFTPPLEENLFGGYSCVFATAGPPQGRKRYGEIKIAISRNFSGLMWATL